MSDVVERIVERLDAMEAAAKAATPGPWWGGGGKGPVRRKQQVALVGRADMRGQGEKGCIAVLAGLNQHRADDAEHIALNDPAAVLAMVAGLRAVVALHTGNRDCGFACRNTTCPTLLAIAGIWEDS